MTDGIDKLAQMMELASSYDESGRQFLLSEHLGRHLPRRDAPLLTSEEAEATKLDRRSSMANNTTTMTQLTTNIEHQLTTIR